MANARGDHITIEVDAVLANELMNMMTTTDLSMSRQRCIFKVPNILKRHNPKAYAPNAFSIGPYHYGRKHLKATQKIKLKYLHDLIFGFKDPDAVLETLIGAIRAVQQEARDHYGDPFDHISADEFVKILVLDGCFLIQLFRRNIYKELQKDDDPVFTVSCMSELLGHDLILLENQIPWMVLERLFVIITKKLEDLPEDSLANPLSLLVLCYCYRTGIIFGKFDAVMKPFVSGELESNKHILDMLRNSLVLPSSMAHERSHEMEAGILFKLKMGLKSLFRKLICLEKCLQNCAPKKEDETKGGKSMPSATSPREAGILFKLKTGLKSLFQKLICLEKSLQNCAPNKEDKSVKWQSMPSATRLREAGIKFKRGTSSNSILDIKFEDGVLEISPLQIHEDTESLFRNLICLEQCLPNCDPIVTSYAILDNLINTTEDMEILCKRGIINNWLNIDDATEFFNQLYGDAFIKKLYYTDLIEKVQGYCGRRWPRYRTVLMHEYLKHPWAFFSIIAATILLILTFVQTVFTIIK